jgi:hypothetical protein
VGVLRVLQRPGWLPLEGRLRLLIGEAVLLQFALVPARFHAGAAEQFDS